MRTKLINIGKETRYVLSQALNRESSRTNLHQFPIILRDCPQDLNAKLLQDCWNYCKSTTSVLKLARGKLSPKARQLISQGENNVIIKFYMDYLKTVFEAFLNTVKLLESQIGKSTSVVLRCTFNKMASEQFIVMVIPGGKWWTLTMPTENKKMEKWFDTLIKGNIFGRCCMVEIYSIVHTDYAISQMNAKNTKTQKKPQ